ncbi:MAG: type II secretion system major pseudopilin GspG [Chromatiales bacterium]|nr:type II secretion system major pseudopilin GspG [Chromatiales bacterium]
MRHARVGHSGFTLIELLVVLVILGLLAGVVGPRVINYLGGAKTDTARLQIQDMAAALDLYRLDVGRYPNNQEGLQALVEAPAGGTRWNGPYLKKKNIPLDPWGNPYQYKMPGEHETFDLFTLGQDNQPGGDGENSDIGNWQ